MVSRPSRRARTAPLWAVVAVVACACVIAPPPPDTPPITVLQEVISGVPVFVAAKAARALNDYDFVTRRFSSDSTWGWSARGQVAARLRYTSPSRDSTRVLVELWGPCRRTGCLRADGLAILAKIKTEEAAPQ